MKTYELTLSKNYVTDWGLREAIREITQNALDSQLAGNPMEISHNNGVLNILNTGCKLALSSLVLGSTSKLVEDANYIGQYGEGYKLALIVLLREGYNVSIYTNNQKWTPYFKMSEVFGIETLHLDVEEHTYFEDLVSFEIKGITYDKMKEIRSKSIALTEAMGHGIGQYEDSEYGRILLDKKYAGQMYVNGLFIQEDHNFTFGYDFKSEYVELDRDRKALNYHKLKELTAKAFAAQENVEILAKALKSDKKDVSELKDVLNEMSQSTKEEFAYYFLDEHDLPEDTFIGTEKQIQVSGAAKSYKTNKITAQLVNEGLGKGDEYEEVVRRVSNLSDTENAWYYYKNSAFKSLLEWVSRVQHKLNITEYNEYMAAMTHWGIKTSYFVRIKDEVFEKLNLVDRKEDKRLK